MMCRSVFSALLLTLAAANAAHASPWVLPAKKVVIGVTAGAGVASSEFLPDRTNQDFPLNGTFHSYQVELGGRVGLGYGFELSMRTSLKGISYVADSVVLVDDASPPGTPDGYRDAVFNFSTSQIGLADIYLGLAHQHLKSPLRLASSLELKLPSGYSAPQQTFADGKFGSGNISDDVALGDGQVDLRYSLQLGYFFNPTRTVLELNVGYCARFRGPGHQALGMLKVGQLITRYLLLFASAELAVTLFDGETIGETYVAKDPSQPARRFKLSNVKTVPLSLDRDMLTVGGGVIVRVLKREWMMRVAHTAWGKNTARLTTFNVGVFLPF